MSEKTIYKALLDNGLNEIGACAMLGNMMAESSLKANIAQRGMTKLTDEQYTDKYNSQPETCYRDSVGYGLCQWTYWSRKQGLWEFAYTRGQSVGDEQMQVDYAIHELKTEYAGLYNYLRTTNDLYTATERICKEYERPAVNNVATRYDFAQDFHDRLVEVKANPSPDFPPDPSIAILQAVLVFNGYPAEISGYKDEKFFATMREFLKDIGG